MFFRSILELPCCKQSTCAFCFAEYVEQRTVLPPADEAKQTTPRSRAHLLPAGTACPQCASVSKATAPLRLIEGHEDVRVSYTDSPRTRAQMEKVSKAAPARDGVAPSPLKVGDDFNAMARKMLPFKDMSPAPAPAPAPAPTPAPAPEPALAEETSMDVVDTAAEASSGRGVAESAAESQQQQQQQQQQQYERGDAAAPAPGGEAPEPAPAPASALALPPSAAPEASPPESGASDALVAETAAAA